jgi:hypothetical protein
VHRNQAGRGWHTKLLVYVASGAAAAAIVGAALGAIGNLLDVDARAGIATLLALAALAVGTAEASGRHARPWQLDRETPQQWLHAGPIQWAARNGAALGIGATTRIGFWSWYVIPAVAVLAGEPGFGASLFATYAVARTTSAWGLIVAGRRAGDFQRLADKLRESAPRMRRVMGAQLAAIAAVTIAVVGF